MKKVVVTVEFNIEVGDSVDVQSIVTNFSAHGEVEFLALRDGTYQRVYATCREGPFHKTVAVEEVGDDNVA